MAMRGLSTQKGLLERQRVEEEWILKEKITDGGELSLG